jgi:hypothetical protein
MVPGGTPSVGPQGDIHVVLLKSFACGGASAWAELNTEWPSYGSIPISIDHTSLSCSDFTYDDLVASGADVLAVSDAAGGGEQFSQEEVAAVAQYTSEGHNLIATYVTFQYGTDNRALAPLLGLRSDLTYNTSEVPISNQFARTDGSACLFRDVPDPWTSSGYSFTQVPADDLRWDESDLAGATIVAQCDDNLGVITIFDAGTYTGIYISNMPEYFGSKVDKQLLYNAITFGPKAAALPYGDGWPGTYGIPSLQASGVPVLGTSITIDIGNSFGVPTMSLFLAGLSSASIPSVYGGTLLVQPLLVVATPLASAGIALPVTIPDDQALAGVSFYLQVLELDLGASRGVSFTPGLQLLLDGC